MNGSDKESSEGRHAGGSGLFLSFTSSQQAATLIEYILLLIAGLLAMALLWVAIPPVKERFTASSDTTTSSTTTSTLPPLTTSTTTLTTVTTVTTITTTTTTTSTTLPYCSGITHQAHCINYAGCSWQNRGEGNHCYCTGACPTMCPDSPCNTSAGCVYRSTMTAGKKCSCPVSTGC